MAVTHARRRYTPRKSNKCNPKCHNSVACMHGGRRHTTRNSHKCTTKSSNSITNKREQMNTKRNNSTAYVTCQDNCTCAHRMQQLHGLHARRKASHAKKTAMMHTKCKNYLACTHARKQNTKNRTDDQRLQEIHGLHARRWDGRLHQAFTGT